MTALRWLTARRRWHLAAFAVFVAIGIYIGASVAR